MQLIESQNFSKKTPTEIRIYFKVFLKKSKRNLKTSRYAYRRQMKI